jgi:hypothetical protein
MQLASYGEPNSLPQCDLPLDRPCHQIIGDACPLWSIAFAAISKIGAPARDPDPDARSLDEAGAGSSTNAWANRQLVCTVLSMVRCVEQ